MSRTVFTIASLLASAAIAQATISADLTLWSEGNLPDSGLPYVSYRIWVHVTDTPPNDPNGYTPGPDDWTAVSLAAALAGGMFYQDPDIDSNPVNPDFFGQYPDCEFTSYYTQPDNYPNTPFNGYIWVFPDEGPTWLIADWFDVGNTGNGDFVLAQVTVLPDQPDWLLTIDLLYAAVNSGGDLFAAHWVVPEPAALTPLALGGLAVLRRRRASTHL